MAVLSGREVGVPLSKRGRRYFRSIEKRAMDLSLSERGRADFPPTIMGWLDIGGSERGRADFPPLCKGGWGGIWRAAVIILAGLAAFAGAQERTAGREPPPPSRPEGFEFVKMVSVSGSAAWTDTKIDVRSGDEFFFEAEGTISLQKDNPVAACGPEGLKLQTMQQPLTGRNLGCLLGKVRVNVAVIEDRQTGEKIERDYGEVFHIGRAALVPMPADGRLLLGANENVPGDNDGAFAVYIYKRES